MFDPLKDLGGLGNLNLGDLMKKAKDMQSGMQRMQEELAKKHITADAGAAMVQATVNGKMELVGLNIDKSKVDVNDTEMLEDVIVAAVARGRESGEGGHAAGDAEGRRRTWACRR